MRPPAILVAEAEHGDVPAGPGERFGGYGVMGLPFTSGHVLALRRFPASSLGPGYTSVWWRDPDDRWTFWQDQPDDQSCLRYFSAAVDKRQRVHIDVTWPTDTTLRVAIPDVDLEWTADLTATSVTRVLNAVGRALPDRAWRARPVLRTMERVAGLALHAGKIGMVGTTPNGQGFIANPMRIWVIEQSSARLGDEHFGTPRALSEQTSLGDFCIPQRGVFAIGRVYYFTPPVPADSGS